MNTIDEWHVESVSVEEYITIADPHIKSVYNKGIFNRLNEDNADKVFYLIVYKKNSPRFATVFGLVGDELKCPFSAPFGYIETLKHPDKLQDYYRAYDLIETFLLGVTKAKSIKIYMAPHFYDMDSISTWMNVFFQHGYCVECSDVNYAFLNIEELVADYEKRMHKNAKKNLNIALKSDLEFIHCSDTEGLEKAYDVIKANRANRQFPLRMSIERLKHTVSIVDNDVFLVEKEEIAIAAAVVYHVTDEIVQVIYWGDAPGYSEYKPINYISYNLLRYYREKGFRHIDVGISTDYGEPNFGLCDFKESIGCTRTNKYRLNKEIEH